MVSEVGDLCGVDSPQIYVAASSLFNLFMYRAQNSLTL